MMGIKKIYIVYQQQLSLLMMNIGMPKWNGLGKEKNLMDIWVYCLDTLIVLIGIQ